MVDSEKIDLASGANGWMFIARLAHASSGADMLMALDTSISSFAILL
jgi:hypothetical protein